MKKREKKRICFLIFFCSLLIVIYMVGVLFFSNHFFMNSRVNNVNCSFLSEQDAKEKMKEEVKKYTLTIKGREQFEYEIQGNEIGLTLNITNEILDILNRQNKYFWPIQIVKQNNYMIDYPVLIEKEQLYRLLDNIEEFKKNNMIKPENAKLGDYNEKTKQYEIIPEKNGNYIYRYKVYDEIKKSIFQLDKECDIEKIQGYRNPVIKKDNHRLIKLQNELNTMVSTDILYKFGEKQEKLDGDLIYNWITIKNKKIILDEEAVYEYVKELSRNYDTAFRKHKFITADRETIVIDKGHYGWWMNKKEEAIQLSQLIRSGEQGERKPVYIQEAEKYGEYDYGNTYIEVDLTKQHLYFWVDGEIYVESDFVSGNVQRGNATPDGIYPITYKERNATLKGEGYANKVSYWMPFNGGIGLHDAPWRKQFGGKIYFNNGSHGCINLPVDVAGQIYEQVYTGMPVICYYSKDES